MTEGWWRELPEAGTEHDICFTPPKVWPRVAAAFVRPQPTEHFIDGDFLPQEKVCLRWLILLRYPEGVSNEEGERWFLRVHAHEVASQPELVRFFSHKVVQGVGNVPGRWRPDTLPPEGRVRTRWDRVLELWYETFDDWRRAVVTAPPAYTRPEWATHPAYPFVRPFEELASTFILERPNDDFLRDVRGYVSVVTASLQRGILIPIFLDAGRPPALGGWSSGAARGRQESRDLRGRDHGPRTCPSVRYRGV